MLPWLMLLQYYRIRKFYRETRKALRTLDVAARADIGVTWLEIPDVARRAAHQAADKARA